MNSTRKPCLRVPGLVLLMAAAAVATSRTTLGQGQVPAQRQVTFTRDVAHILQRSCQTCHRPGMMAPMSLLSYQDARPWARSMKTKVSNREMPPWFIDKGVGIQKFKNDPSLSDAEVDTIVKWVEQAALRGNPAHRPAPRQFDDLDAWHIKPDLIFKTPKPFMLRAKGPD